MDIDDCLRDRYCYNAYYKNDDSYEDVLEAFIEEAISATTPKWYNWMSFGVKKTLGERFGCTVL